MSAIDLTGETDCFYFTRVSVISVFGRTQTGIFMGGMLFSWVEISCIFFLFRMSMHTIVTTVDSATPCFH